MARKGQAAMEFLMTYGWAILAAIVVIGVLGYYYVSSDILTPKQAVVNAPFYIKPQFVVNTTGYTIELENRGGVDVTISNITIGECGLATTFGAMASGGSNVTLIPCGLTTGDSVNEDITITYTASGSSIEVPASGSITATVA